MGSKFYHENSKFNFTLVMTPRVLEPFLSISMANLRPSEVDISLLAATTAKIIVLSSYPYLEYKFIDVTFYTYQWLLFRYLQTGRFLSKGF